MVSQPLTIRADDEIVVSPNLVGSIVHVGQEVIEGFSTHEMLFMDLQFQGRLFRGIKQTPARPTDEVDWLIAKADRTHWDGAGNWEGDSVELHNKWLDTLNAYLGLRQAKVGKISLTQACEDCDGKAPLLVRALQRQNLLREVDAWISELLQAAHKRNMNDTIVGHHAGLTKRLQAMPWSAWNTDPPMPLHVYTWNDMITFLIWAESEWPQCRINAEVIARGAVSTWRRDFLKAIKGGHLGRVARWKKGPAPTPIIKEGNEFKAHPAEVCAVLRDAWSTIYDDPRGDQQYNPGMHASFDVVPAIPQMKMPTLQAEHIHRMVKTKKSPLLEVTASPCPC